MIKNEGFTLLNGNFEVDIRITSARYGGGFNAIGIVWECCTLDHKEVDSYFIDLNGGDNDYSEAVRYFESASDITFMQNVSIESIVNNMDRKMCKRVYG